MSLYEDVWGEDERGVKRREGQTDEEKYWLGSRLESDGQDHITPATPMEAARRGYEFYKRLQAPDGHWSGEYGGESNVVLLEWLGTDLALDRSAVPHAWSGHCHVRDGNSDS